MHCILRGWSAARDKTGRATIVIFGDSADRVNRVAVALRGVNAPVGASAAVMRLNRSRADERASRAARVVERVRAIPEGYVRTYGDIDARAPRLVGRILATTHDLPWHRVVRADGTIPQGQSQRELLLAEGVPMRGDHVDLDQARLPPEL